MQVQQMITSDMPPFHHSKNNSENFLSCSTNWNYVTLSVITIITSDCLSPHTQKSK